MRPGRRTERRGDRPDPGTRGPVRRRRGVEHREGFVPDRDRLVRRRRGAPGKLPPDTGRRLGHGAWLVEYLAGLPRHHARRSPVERRRRPSRRGTHRGRVRPQDGGLGQSRFRRVLARHDLRGRRPAEALGGPSRRGGPQGLRRGRTDLGRSLRARLRGGGAGISPSAPGRAGRAADGQEGRVLADPAYRESLLSAGTSPDRPRPLGRPA